MRPSPSKPQPPSVEDQLQDEQTRAAVDALAGVLRGLVMANPDVKVRALTRNGLTTMAVTVISAYLLKRAEQEARDRGPPADVALG